MDSKIDLVRGFSEEMYKGTYTETKSTLICVRCGEPVRETESDSKLERLITALCAECRDEIIYRCLHRG